MKITRITDRNIDAFSHVLPMKLWGQKDRLFLGVLSDEREAIAGMSAAIYSKTASIEWLYTLPSRREQGAASELIETMRVLVNDLDINTIEIVFEEEREGLDLFLSERGFLIGSNADMYRIPICDIIYGEEMDWFLETARDTRHVLSPTDEDAYSRLLGFLGQRGMEHAAKDISLDLSLVRFDENKQVTGCMLLQELDEKDIGICYFVNDGNLSAISDFVLGLYRRMGNEEYAGRYLTFEDMSGGSAIGVIEQLTGEDREDYRISGTLRGVLVL